MTLVYSVKFSISYLCQVAIPSGLVLPNSRNVLEGRGLVFRLLLLTCQECLGWVQRWALVCWLAWEPGWTPRGLSHGCLSDICPPAIFLPHLHSLVIDCPASCVCLHCLGVQLDRASFWQVPQPGASALDVQRTVHVCQVRVCLLCPRREESSGEWRVFAVLRTKRRWPQDSHSAMNFTSCGRDPHTNYSYMHTAAVNKTKPEGIGPSCCLLCAPFLFALLLSEIGECALRQSLALAKNLELS